MKRRRLQDVPGSGHFSHFCAPGSQRQTGSQITGISTNSCQSLPGFLGLSGGKQTFRQFQLRPGCSTGVSGMIQCSPAV